MKRLITSESVSFGHPDKIADQISDGILDAYLEKDPNSKVAVETMVKDNCVILGGEVTSSIEIDHNSVVNSIVKDIGFSIGHGFNYKALTIINLIGKQSLEINSAVELGDGEIGAGDQGFMVGYATSETSNYMPIGINISKKIVDYVSTFSGLGPDCKCQVTIEEDSDNNSKRVFSILVSTMHKSNIKLSDVDLSIRNGIESNLMNLDISVSDMIDDKTKIIINPAGEWFIGGPVSDCGITGRKIVVDQYGPYCPVGGGCFSSKDPSKVDRSGAYLARYIAKNIVASSISSRCKVEISYMIGISEPSSINIDTYGEFSDDSKLIRIVKEIFPMTPTDIINHFDLKTPIYLDTAKHGHFGRNSLPWEKIDMVDVLRKEFKW